MVRVGCFVCRGSHHVRLSSKPRCVLLQEGIFYGEVHAATGNSDYRRWRCIRRRVLLLEDS